jgi:hypothetical protein
MRKTLLAVAFSCTVLTTGAQQIAGSPEEIHAYALAELGWHSEAIKLLEAVHGKDGAATVGALLTEEQRAYRFSQEHTRECSPEMPCMAEDLLAVGRLSEALAAQKQQIKEVRAKQSEHQRKGEEREGGHMTVKLADETDSTGGKLAELADAYDLEARIEAALGQAKPALHSLDAAEKALPEGKKMAPRAAGYAYHRALILAEDHNYAAAAKACDASMSLDAGSAALGVRREQECQAIAAAAR